MYPKTAVYPSDLSDEQWLLIEPLELDKRWGSGRGMQLE